MAGGEGGGDARAALDVAMERYAEGDAAAFGTVYDLLAPRLLAYFARQTRDRALAEDLTQQTLLQMHRARQTFVPGSAVTPWAFAIGRRLLIDSYRRRKHERRLVRDGGEEAASDARISLEGSPDEVFAANQMAARVSARIEALPEAQRVAYQLVRDDGLTMTEAAQVLGTSASAVKQRVFRTYEALRTTLGFGEGSDAGGSDS